MYFTVFEPCRLSVWLLARILNLSVQASRSNFTPTTEEATKKVSKLTEENDRCVKGKDICRAETCQHKVTK